MIDFRDAEPESPPQTLGYRPELVAGVALSARIVRERGAVGTPRLPCETHGQAKWRARRLRLLLVAFGHFEAWEIQQRVWPSAGGYRWAVELVGGARERSAAPDV